MLEITLKSGAGEIRLSSEKADIKEALAETLWLLEKQECTLCKKFAPLQVSKAQDITYAKRKCIDWEGCGAQSNLGSYKSGGYFWNKFEKWTPESK